MAFVNTTSGDFCNFGSSNDDRASCPWCEVKYKHLHLLPGSVVTTAEISKSKSKSKILKGSTATEVYSGAPTRTLRRQCWLAHMPYYESMLKDGESQFPFTCPACDAVFNSQQVSDNNRIFLSQLTFCHKISNKTHHFCV